MTPTVRHSASLTALAAAGLVLTLASSALAGARHDAGSPHADGHRERAHVRRHHHDFHPGRRLFVGHGPAGDNKGCHSPGYTSVQMAVDAASDGDTVYLCGAQFAEQVFVSRRITLTGDATSGLTAVGTVFTTAAERYPAAFTAADLLAPQVLLVVTGPAASATVEALAFSGPMPGNGSCASEAFGILIIDGAHARLSQIAVRDIADTNPDLYGCQFGVGIQVGRRSWPAADFSHFAPVSFIGTADIDGATVDGYQKSGIAVDGPGSRAEIRRSAVTGGGPGAPFGTVIAQIGIQIARGADARVSHTAVSDNAYSGPGFAVSSGVLVFGGCGNPVPEDVDVHHNALVDNDVGISLVQLNDACNGPATAPTRAKVNHNWISNAAVTNTSGFDGSIGYQAGIRDIGNRDEIHHNALWGLGYAPRDPGAAFVRPIDIESFPTTKPTLHHNSYNGRPYPPHDRGHRDEAEDRRRHGRRD
jgi:hypothetical protein